MLNNLLSNAVKYTEQGWITFRVNGEWKDERYWLQIAVLDTGIGIREEDLDQVFESFKRLELDKTHYIEGTGLGLNITKQLVETMGGTISVESVHGKGSCFTVVIPQSPLTEQDEERVSREAKNAEQNPDKGYLYLPEMKILAVDDNKMNLTVLKALLKRSRMQVDSATSGMECIDMTKQEKYDLILMDHMMPGVDGIQAMHLIQEDEENPNRTTPMIALTANAIDGMEQMYLAEGFAGYLSKPIVAEQLETMLGEFLVNKPSHTEQQ